MYVEEQIGQHLPKLLPALCQVCCARLHSCTSHFIEFLTVWGVEPDVTHQTSWLESTRVLASVSQVTAYLSWL